jgi:hypothetical protein
MANASGPSEMECEAANAVAQLLRGTFNYRDVPGAPNGTHDFDIDVDNDGTIALEVTSLVVEKFKAMEAALGERYWFDERLRFNWCPTIVIANRKSKGTDIRTLRASVGAIFKSLEDRYVSGPNALMYTDLIASGEFLKSHPVDPDLLSLYELGVRNLNVLIPYDGRAMISVGYVGIPENQEINDLVTEEIDNNYEKLLRTAPVCMGRSIGLGERVENVSSRIAKSDPSDAQATRRRLAWPLVTEISILEQCWSAVEGGQGWELVECFG